VPKAIPILPSSPLHNLAAGDLVDRLGSLKAEITALEAREKALREELIRRGDAVLEGDSFEATIHRSGALDARQQGHQDRDGRVLVRRAVPAIAGDDGRGQSPRRCRRSAARSVREGAMSESASALGRLDLQLAEIDSAATALAVFAQDSLTGPEAETCGYLAARIKEHAAAANLASIEPVKPPAMVDRSELRRRIDAILAEFGGSLPPATDSGILDAERRLTGLRHAYNVLADEIGWDVETEQDIVEPTLCAAENALIEFIETTAPQSLAAAAAKIRETLVAAHPDLISPLRQVLVVVEREASAGAIGGRVTAAMKPASTPVDYSLRVPPVLHPGMSDRDVIFKAFQIAAGMEEGLREIGQFSTIVMRLATSLDEEQDQGMFSQLGMLLRDLHEAIEEDRGKLFRLLHPWPEGRLMGDHQAEGGVA
jgi:hypothetical protein